MAQVALSLRMSHESDIDHRASVWQWQRQADVGFRTCAQGNSNKWDTLNDRGSTIQLINELIADYSNIYLIDNIFSSI